MAASYPYSMLGYSYPPGAYLQVPGYGLPAATHQQLGALLGPQGLAGLGAQNWAAAGSPAHLMAAQQAAYATSKQGYPVIAPMGGGAAVSAAGSPPKLSFGGGGVAASMPAATAPGGGCGRAVAEPAEARPEAAAGGEGEEYLQELIKERDSIESNSTSSLSKTHILRLLNRGKHSQGFYTVM
jgi:hypothetical protein